MRTWADVAVLAKTKNLQGGFVVQRAASLPFLLHVGLEVAFVPPALEAPRRAVVESVQMRDERTAVVTFVGINHIDIAERLAGCHCLVRRSDLPADAFEEAGFEWRGWDVCDASAGLLGQAEDLEELPYQSLLSVVPLKTDPDDEAGKVILIPFVDAFIKSIDEEAHRINVEVPSGLLDL